MTTRTTTALVATTVELETDQPIDLAAVAGDTGVLWEREGDGFAACGVVQRVDVPDGLASAGAAAASTLAAIDASDDIELAGSGPIAIAAFPFAPGAPCSIVVPALVVGRRAGRQWLTTIAPEGSAHPTLTIEPNAAVDDLPDGFTLVSPRPHAAWRATVADAVDAIERGELQKVVIAREVVVEANKPIVVGDVLGRLRALYPSCTVFSVDGFVGASPELLVSRDGLAVRSHPLAGTYPRSGDPHADELLAKELFASGKDRREHQFLVDMVAAVLGEACDEIDVPDEPSILPLRNVLHLGTDVCGRLRSPAPGVFDLAARLHPTPAVGGTPTAAALQWLAANEQLDRGRYAGPVGWTDGRGDGEVVIGIRCAEIDGPRARLFAGVGVVAGSDPQTELTETQLKLQALLAALVRP